MARTIKEKPNRYRVHYGNKYDEYRDKDWAIHSAECVASFYRDVALVVDNFTGELVATVIPNNDGIGYNTVR